MGAETAISWAHATFNPWWGCVEVSPECDACYARSWARRTGHDVWGAKSPRRMFSDNHWREPVRWNAKARSEGQRRRVFCASMADIGERRTGSVGRALDDARARLWDLIDATPALDWLLLTKRPDLYQRMPMDILNLPNVWPGVTCGVESSLWRVAELLRVTATGPKWISAEPLLSHLDLRRVPWGRREPGAGHAAEYVDALWGHIDNIKWVVVGCESSPGGRPGRPLDLCWVRGLRDQCRSAGLAFYLKQLAVDGRLVITPTLDGRSWTEFPGTGRRSQ
jgi:protein gp37